MNRVEKKYIRINRGDELSSIKNTIEGMEMTAINCHFCSTISQLHATNPNFLGVVHLHFSPLGFSFFLAYPSPSCWRDSDISWWNEFPRKWFVLRGPANWWLQATRRDRIWMLRAGTEESRNKGSKKNRKKGEVAAARDVTCAQLSSRSFYLPSSRITNILLPPVWYYLSQTLFLVPLHYLSGSSWNW